MPVIAVTGATGFVGQTAVARLRQHSPDTRLRLLVRQPDQRDLPRAFAGCDIIAGDLGNPGSLDRLVREAGCVVHIAAAIAGNRADDFAHANIAGTRRLAEAIAEHAPQAHLIQVSSLAARRPELSWYAASKRSAEEIVTSNITNHSIVRPPAVYGPRDPTLAALWRMLAHGWLVRPGSTRALFSILHVDDLVEVICRLIDHGPTGLVMPLAGPQPEAGWSWAEIARVAGEESGRQIRTIPLPAPALRIGAMTSLLVSRTFGRRALLSPGKARELLHPDWVCDNHLVKQRLGWRPTTRLERTLATLPGWSES